MFKASSVYISCQLPVKIGTRVRSGDLRMQSSKDSNQSRSTQYDEKCNSVRLEIPSTTNGANHHTLKQGQGSVAQRWTVATT
eukprot:6174181-Pleurochrysis_carterae.AAC.1